MSLRFYDVIHLQSQTSLVRKSCSGKWSIHAISLFVLIGSMAFFPAFMEVNGQSGAVFKVIVQITNTGNLDEHGTIHVSIDGSRTPQVQNNLVFPGLQTMTYTFDFSANEAPVGKGFTAEVIYGDDEFKRAYGSNSPANSPETVSISIP